MKLLDLCCGEGLASWGYYLSGLFTDIVGVDVEDMSSSYSFTFWHKDALTLTYDDLLQFDFIHASPPCQAYSKVTPAHLRASHPRLILPIRHMLYATGKPFVIENVEGSGQELKPTLRLYGADVGLPIARPRYFNTSWKPSEQLPGANLQSVYEVHGTYRRRAELVKLFGLDSIPEKSLKRMTRHGILQGIPPAMTRWIAFSYISTWQISTDANVTSSRKKHFNLNEQLLI